MEKGLWLSHTQRQHFSFAFQLFLKLFLQPMLQSILTFPFVAHLGLSKTPFLDSISPCFPFAPFFWSSCFFPELGGGGERLALASTAAPAAWLPASPGSLWLHPRTLRVWCPAAARVSNAFRSHHIKVLKMSSFFKVTMSLPRRMSREC